MTTITAISARQGHVSTNHAGLRLMIISTGLAVIGLMVSALIA